jgi:uncharacterized repeat protein (TIGR01451 family)
MAGAAGATFCYTGTNAGSDTVSASAVGQGSGSAGITWSSPQKFADLSVTITQSPTSPAAGGQVTFTITIANAGPDDAAAAHLAVPVPKATTLVSTMPSQGSCDQTVLCSLGTINASQSAAVTLVVQTSAVGPLQLAATASSSATDRNPANDSATASSTVVAPQADLNLTLAGPTKATFNKPFTVTASLTDNGPQPAANAVLAFHLPKGFQILAALPSTGSCPPGSGSCAFGTIAAATTVQVTLTLLPSVLGALQVQATASSDTADPSSANNNAALAVAVALPAPVRGKSVDVQLVKGRVLVNGKPLRLPASIPVGSMIDTTHGVLRLTSVNGSFLIYGGAFKLLESTRRGTPTELRLTGRSFAVCGARHTAVVSASPKKVVRLLWGNGKGSFKTTGKYVSAAVSGTYWLTEDRCDGSLVAVRRGTVIVTNLLTGKRMKVHSGQSEFVKKP